jgi:tape measure domain-containing protein
VPGTTIGSTALYLTADDQKLQKGLDSAASRFSKFRKGAEADAAGLRAKIEHALDFTSILKAVGVVGGIGAGIGAGLSLTGLVSDAIKLAGAVEDTKTDFKVLIGDAEKASKLFGEIKEFADATPFTNAQLTDPAKLLLGVGVAANQIVPTLKALGDLTGADGERLKEVAGIYGKVRTEGRVTGETLQQFTEHLIPLNESLAAVLGKQASEIKGLAEEGKISFPDLQRAIIQATSEGGRFFGRMEEGSKTFNGLALHPQGELGGTASERRARPSLRNSASKTLLIRSRRRPTSRTATLMLSGPCSARRRRGRRISSRDLYEGGFAFAHAIAQAKDSIGEIRAEYRDIRDSVLNAPFAGFRRARRPRVVRHPQPDRAGAGHARRVGRPSAINTLSGRRKSRSTTSKRRWTRFSTGPAKRPATRWPAGSWTG